MDSEYSWRVPIDPGSRASQREPAATQPAQPALVSPALATPGVPAVGATTSGSDAFGEQKHRPLRKRIGSALAALAGVLAAPVVQVSPLMGSSLVIVVFAVVVIGGMGSIVGAIISGLVLGLVEGLTKVIYPEASNIVVFVIMALVLIWRPAGLFGKEQ